ncbi:uncharacterized protein LOC127379576 isoform X6 [Dicentrarchus labrax]|uniref:uncharacterized protein LOC127379576 isoform X6 n=1 Tax=Dicentrarchus labrax TaxID=13489 RepID=UPI0021F5FABE|nr:uncharacterized protein LOC127379576 isoform X6 [Dicentrarchus labrax]
MPPRVSPLKDALQHLHSKTDKTSKLEVKYINAVKGRGIFALSSFSKGDFVLEYRGDMIDNAESQRRRRIYHPSCVAFMFSFKWRGRTWCIDASQEDGSFGRLVNDEHIRPNCRMKRIDVDRKPHLCLFALNDIQHGEEITYDYGGEDCPQRMQMTMNAADVIIPVDSSHPADLLETRMDETAQDTNQQMTMNAADGVISGESSHSAVLLGPHMDETAQDTNQQMTMNAADGVISGESSHSAVLLGPHMDETAQDTNQQMTMNAADVVIPRESYHPADLLETQMDQTAQDTNQQMTMNAADGVISGESSHSAVLLGPHMDETAQDTNQQMTMNAADGVISGESSHSAVLLGPHMDETAQDTNQQMTMNATDVIILGEIYHSAVLLEIQSDDVSSPQDTNQQMTMNAADVVIPEESSYPAVFVEMQMDEAFDPPDSNQQMKDTDVEESNDESDSASGSSDEYIPDTTSESEESDASLKPRTKPFSLDDVLNDSGSMSPPVCDTTTLDHVIFDSNTTTYEVTEADGPCTSQDMTDSIVVRASKKRNGNRVYNKRHYCLYCRKPYAKMARHLESAHQDKSDVAKALSFPKGSKERKKQLDYIRNRGNYAHNAAVMESGNGELVPFKQPPKEAKGGDFMHCAYCQGLFTRKVLWRHMRSCKLQPGSVRPRPGKNRVQSLCTFTGPVPSHISKQLWGVISAMKPDPITDTIKNDHVITDVGQHLLNKGGMSAKNQQCVREKMREMGRLVHNAKRVSTLNKMEDFINPKNYLDMVKAVKLTCGFDSDTNTFLIPSLANKLGNALVKVSKLLKAQGLISENKELVRNATEFQEVHSEKWNEMVSATALRNIAEAKWNVPTLMPFTEDVQKMHQFLSQMQNECSNALSESPSTKAWLDLAKVCLAQTILFNRRREGEVGSMPLSAFLSRDSSDPHQDLDWALSEVEKKLCRHFSRIIIRGKRGRPVPILLTPKMLCALELLVKHREACGVLKDNAYMFARPTAMTHIRGSDCIRGFAKECGAKCPESLTSTRLRKHAATLSTVLNMTDTEMDQLANFLGHDIRIHREFYRLPEKTLQLAKISKVLMALEQGRLAEFHGKNLDEITINPDEKVLDCDEEDGKREEENCSSAVNEQPADETIPPTEGNEFPSTIKTRKLPSAEEVVSSEACAVRPSYKEPSAEETLTATEGNEFPSTIKRHKLPSAEEVVSSGVSAVRPSYKGKTGPKKKPWQQAEVQAVEKHMSRFITSCIVPAKSDCEKCLRAEPVALKNRDWHTLKFYVYNRITAYKRKMSK